MYPKTHKITFLDEVPEVAAKKVGYYHSIVHQLLKSGKPVCLIAAKDDKEANRIVNGCHRAIKAEECNVSIVKRGLDVYLRINKEDE